MAPRRLLVPQKRSSQQQQQLQENNVTGQNDALRAPPVTEQPPPVTEQPPPVTEQPPPDAAQGEEDRSHTAATKIQSLQRQRIARKELERRKENVLKVISQEPKTSNDTTQAALTTASVAPHSAPVPVSVALQSAPVPASAAPQSAPVPASAAPQSAPVPVSVAPQSAPVPASAAPQSAPVPASAAPQSAPVAPQSAPVPASAAPQSAPVPASPKTKADSAAVIAAAAAQAPRQAKAKLAPKPPQKASVSKVFDQPRTSRIPQPEPTDATGRPESAPITNSVSQEAQPTEEPSPPTFATEVKLPATPPQSLDVPPDAAQALQGGIEDPPTEGRAMTDDDVLHALPACDHELGRSFGRCKALDTRSPKKYGYEPLFAKRRPEMPPPPSDPYVADEPSVAELPQESKKKKVRVADDPVITALEKTLAQRRAEAKRRQELSEMRAVAIQKKMEEAAARRAEETHLRRMEELRRIREAQEERLRFYDDLQRERLERISRHVKIDPDVVTGKKSITQLFEERRVQTRIQEEEERRRALERRHKECAMGKDFYEHLSEHEKAVLKRQQDAEAERQKRKEAEELKLPLLQYRTHAMHQVLSEEEQQRRLMIHERQDAIEKRNVMLQYGEEVKRHHMPQSASTSLEVTPRPRPSGRRKHEAASMTPSAMEAERGAAEESS